MKKIINLLLLVIILSSCVNNSEMEIAIVPKPSVIKVSNGSFNLKNNTVIIPTDNNQQLRLIAESFVNDIQKYYSLNLKIDESAVPSDGNAIVLVLLKSENETDESYVLESGKKNITITALSPAGIFYGLKSLEQIILTSPETGKNIKIASVYIEDAPRFKWRGMHLDVGRHFMSVEDVKSYLDYMALYKFNTFHWHLTEDQGWRIEIKKYPELTNVAAWRDSTLSGHYSDKPVVYNTNKYGGFYTQEEIKEVVEYAAKRFITVVPEIEMPGHAQAAIAAYPELGVSKEKVNVKTEWGISPWIYMPSETSFAFLEDVLTEVIELFPSEYIHIGGDEAIKDQWLESAEVQKIIKTLGLKDEHELQSYFIQRIEKFLNSKGRKIIGWDEILEGGLAPNATVMSWRGEAGGIAAAKLKHDVIMSPVNYCYFDYYQSEPQNEPLAIGGYLPLDSVYLYDPVPMELSPDEAKYILGVQANVWTEYIPDFSQVEYMIFPRILAMSEIAWSKPCGKNLNEFHSRVDLHENLFKKLGVNYWKKKDL